MAARRKQEKGGFQFPLSPSEWEGAELNDALAYGVTIRPAKVSPGEPYWKAVRVHHLTPEENQGRHHLFIEVLDEHGHRVVDARVRITSEAGEKIVRVIGDDHQAAVTFPMDKWDIYDVEVLGLPSDRVVGLTAAHPEEGKGNPAFRHSFLIVWQRTVAPVATAAPPTAEAPEAVAAAEAPAEQTAPASEGIAAQEPATEAATQERPPEGPVETPHAEGAQEEGPAPEHVPAAELAEPEREMAAPEVSEPAAPLFDVYVLFLEPQNPRTLGAFFVLLDDIIAAGLPFGFGTFDAALRARRLIVVGTPSSEQRAQLSEGPEEVLVLSGTGDKLRQEWARAFSAG